MVKEIYHVVIPAEAKRQVKFISDYIVIYKGIEDKKQVQIRAFWYGSQMPPKL